MKLLHAPQHMGDHLDQNLDTILRLKPIVAGLTEQDGGKKDNVSRITKKVGKAYFVCTAPADESHSREIVVLIRKGSSRKIQSVVHKRLSPDLPDGVVSGLGNDRHLLVVRWKGIKNQYAHVLTHWNAVIQDKDSGLLLHNDRAEWTDKSAAPKLESVLESLRLEDRYVTGNADLNYRQKLPKSGEWKYAPQNIFKRTKFDFFSTGLDWVWYRGFKHASTLVIPSGSSGNYSDHPWLLTDLTR